MTRARCVAITVLTAVLLSSCGKSAIGVRYRLVVRTTDPAALQALIDATKRMIPARVEHLKATVLSQHVTDQIDGAVLALTVSDEKIIPALTDELTNQSFSIQMMRAATSNEKADVQTEKGGFVDSGMTARDVEGVDAATAADQKGAVRIRFTDEGKKKFAALYQSAMNSTLGVFVRGVPVSFLAIHDSAFPKDLVIRGIPSPAIAQSFADDVNISLSITFVPLP